METRSTDLAPVGKRNLQREEAAEENLQYLTFNLAGESYGVDILKVQESRGWAPVTKVPNAPAFVRGVMNLRGAIVPVVDLRLRFSLESMEYNKTTVVIVVTVHTEQSDRIIGMVVDGVSDVLNINNPADIKEAPNFGAAVGTEFISGLVALDSGMVMLLDVDRLLSVEEMFSLEAVQGSSTPALAHAS